MQSRNLNILANGKGRIVGRRRGHGFAIRAADHGDERGEVFEDLLVAARMVPVVVRVDYGF
jgi:hypothetical protein